MEKWLIISLGQHVCTGTIWDTIGRSVTLVTPKAKSLLKLMLSCDCYSRRSKTPRWGKCELQYGLWIFVVQHFENTSFYPSLSALSLNSYHMAHEYDIQKKLLQHFITTRLGFSWAFPRGISINFGFISNTVANIRTFSLLLSVKLVLLQRFDHFTLTMQRKSKENWFYCKEPPQRSK